MKKSEDFKSCAISFKVPDGSTDIAKAAYDFMVNLPKNAVPTIIEFKLEGTLSEIEGITDNPDDKYVTVRAYNGQDVFDPKRKKPHGTSCHVGYLDKEMKKNVRFSLNLETGFGKIERIR